jgi:ubiquitin C-terminal hydrolase
MAMVDGSTNTGNGQNSQLSNYDFGLTGAKPRGNRPYVGLSNQGATCYMNSLLQSMFATPEFRSQLYNWAYDSEKHGEAKDSIPL